MPFTFTMPKLSPTMEEGTIVKWRVKEGDRIQVGDALVEVATDKATVEHSSLEEGYLRKILVAEGQTALVNQPLAIFTSKREESIEGYAPEGLLLVKEEKKETAAISENHQPTPIKTTESPALMQQPAFIPEAPLENYEFAFPESALNERILASPLAKKLAKEKGIDLTTIKGTGPGGRILSRDLEWGQKSGIVAFGRREMPESVPGSYEEEPLTPMRKAISRRLQESKTFIPHFYTSLEIDALPMIELREQLKKGEIKISVNDFVIRASALSLREYPQINSGFNSVNSSIIRFKTIDIAIAVSLESGLITPIIRHADYKNLGQLSVEIKQLAEKARIGKLAREEYMGGSFTISNLGMYGVTDFMAIINPPQAAILAVGGIHEKPVIKSGQIVNGKTMKLMLSCDHRVLDGVDAAKFLKILQKYLENPALLLI